MANEALDEAAIEASLDALAQQVRTGELPEAEPVKEEAVEEETETVAEAEPEESEEEAKARADGHVSYDEWVRAGKDPRAWRPAEEYNRRGELLKTGKPELIERLEKATRATEDAAKLFAEQARISREAQERARQEGYERALQEAREAADLAFSMGDKKAHDEAQERARQAERALTQPTAPDPTKDPELLSWQEESKWFKEGFDHNGQPKTLAVKAFLVSQKEYMIANPGARLIDSVRHAESELKEAMPQLFKPATPQARTTAPTVDSGNRVATKKPGPSLDKYDRAEQRLIADAAKAFGKSIPDYLKMIEEG